MAGPRLWIRRLRGVDGDVVAEQTAAAVGSWAFICCQAFVMMLWVVWNAVGPRFLRYDQFPYVFLNLAMSAEAAFTGPILLIASNVAAGRDRKQAARIEHLASHLEQLASFDHEEHTRLLREIHAHTRCVGHTTIESGPLGHRLGRESGAVAKRRSERGHELPGEVAS